MEIRFISDSQVIIENVSDFDLFETFNCGQCFRWNQVAENSFIGVAFGKVVKILKQNNKVVLNGDDIANNFDSVWKNYFDLCTDYSKIKETISKLDCNLSMACKYAPGIRILRQEPWETLCSFIISQNNNIPRIKGIIERLCALFGDEIEPRFFSFPSYKTLAALEKSDLAPIKCGFRDDYILDAAKKLTSGEVSFENISNFDVADARTELMKIKGVGPKVAECVLLYGFYKLQAFPVDVWMKRAMESLFPGKNPCFFGDYAGIAQQYIFHFSRMNSHLVK